MSSSPPEPSVIVDRLRTAREHAGLSQGQVAKLLDMHRPTISEIEAGRRRLTAEELVRFSDLYGVGLDWLTGKASDRIDLADIRVAMVARDLNKLKEKDLERVLNFIASVQGERK